MSLDPSAIEALVHQHTASTSFSGVLAVYEAGSIVYEYASGFANRSDSVPNTIMTRFGTASGTKTFTAVAICQLAARGLLTFETPLGECLPRQMTSFDPGVTIHHLLTHTSGIPDYFDEDVMTDYAELWHDLPVYRMRTPADFLPLFRDKPMMFAPGARFHYNNAGFVVLALVVEHLTGIAFSEYVSEHVFKASGMHDSGYFATNALPPRTALGYIDDENGSPLRTNIFAVPIIGGGDGGAYVTAPDTLAFWSAVFENRLMPEYIRQSMLAPHTQVNDRVYYGYGNWITVDTNGKPFKYVQSGGDPGVVFYASCFPERDICIVTASNTSSGSSAIAKAVEQSIRLT